MLPALWPIDWGASVIIWLTICVAILRSAIESVLHGMGVALDTLCTNSSSPLSSSPGVPNEMQLTSESQSISTSLLCSGATSSSSTGIKRGYSVDLPVAFELFLPDLLLRPGEESPADVAPDLRVGAGSGIAAAAKDDATDALPDGSGAVACAAGAAAEGADVFSAVSEAVPLLRLVRLALEAAGLGLPGTTPRPLASGVGALSGCCGSGGGAWAALRHGASAFSSSCSSSAAPAMASQGASSPVRDVSSAMRGGSSSVAPIPWGDSSKRGVPTMVGGESSKIVRGDSAMAASASTTKFEVCRQHPPGSARIRESLASSKATCTFRALSSARSCSTCASQRTATNRASSAFVWAMRCRKSSRVSASRCSLTACCKAISRPDRKYRLSSSSASAEAVVVAAEIAVSDA
mmetsp:Transcript_67542/g.195264  ORF Transcript_67542/g.195264 Transcript_67542/m.195264 type:complete len:407 (-) Transcript_67542:121-1341(-)